jgi:phosphatidylglycerophosphatase A
MKKYKIMFYGVLISFFLSVLYSIYIHVTDPTWGDLAAVASFIVIFPSALVLTLLIQLGYIIYCKKSK